MDSDRKWLISFFTVMLLVPLILDLGYYGYRLTIISSWSTNFDPYVTEIRSVIADNPGYFTGLERAGAQNFTITLSMARTAAGLAVSRLNSQALVTASVVLVVVGALLLYQSVGNGDPPQPAQVQPPQPASSTPPNSPSKISLKRYETDMDLAKWLMNLGGAGGSSASLVSGVLLSKTTSLYLVVAFPMFAMIIVFGLLARGAMSGLIESEDGTSLSISQEGYDAFWDSIRLQFYLLFLAIPLLALGVAT